MENFYIAPTRTTPEIRFDCQKHIFEIKGESFPEDTAAFYGPLLSWLEAYLATLKDQELIINIEVIYFNSSSSKVFLDLFDMLDEAAGKGRHISVNWIYDEESESALLYGEEFQEDIEYLAFNLIQKEL